MATAQVHQYRSFSCWLPFSSLLGRRVQGRCLAKADRERTRPPAKTPQQASLAPNQPPPPTRAPQTARQLPPDSNTASVEILPLPSTILHCLSPSSTGAGSCKSVAGCRAFQNLGSKLASVTSSGEPSAGTAGEPAAHYDKIETLSTCTVCRPVRRVGRRMPRLACCGSHRSGFH